MRGAWSPSIVGAPRLKRYQAFGNLFAAVDGVGHRLDRHPTMSRHPVTPMHEADLRLHLREQTGAPHRADRPGAAALRRGRRARRAARRRRRAGRAHRRARRRDAARSRTARVGGPRRGAVQRFVVGPVLCAGRVLAFARPAAARALAARGRRGAGDRRGQRQLLAGHGRADPLGARQRLRHRAPAAARALDEARAGVEIERCVAVAAEAIRAAAASSSSAPKGPTTRPSPASTRSRRAPGWPAAMPRGASAPRSPK